MKRHGLTLFISAGLAAITTAGAQTWEFEQGPLSLVGCNAVPTGVTCDFTYTLAKVQTSKAAFRTDFFKIFTQDGTAQTADLVSIAGNKLTSSYTETVEIIYGVPIKVQAYFNISSSTPSLRALEINDIRLENVPIRAAAGSRPPVAVAMPNAVNVKGFSIALSNCLLKGQDYTCTATLTPNK